MKKRLTFPLLILFLLIFGLTSASCNRPANEGGTGDGSIDITQAYQTVDARLTQAVALTPEPPAATEATGAQDPTPTTGEEPATPSATPAAPAPPTVTPTPMVRCDQAAAAYPEIDITVPDDTEIPAGNVFTKVWRVVNTGTCNWTANYQAFYDSGDLMGAPAAVNITEPVAPGQTIDIAVNFTAPLEAGTYQSNWKLRNAAGEEFGIGNSGTEAFWVRIQVGEVPTPTPTATTEPEPDVAASGSASLTVNDLLDLDSLQINNGGDISYIQVATENAETRHQFVAQAGAALGEFGGGQPTYYQCKNAAIAPIPVDLVDRTEGTYFCYRTDQGQTGWLRFDAIDTGAGMVDVTILTWVAPEE